MKNKLILGTVVFLFVGLVAVCGYIVGVKTGNKSILVTMQESQASLIEADSLLVEARAVMARQDSCLVMCHKQGMYTYNKWQECSEKHVEGLAYMLKASLPDSTVLIDGILYECAAGAKTAWNDGIADEH